MMTTKLSLPELDTTKLPDRCRALLDEMHEETGIRREILLSVILTVMAASVQIRMKLNFPEGNVPAFRYLCVFHQHQAVEKPLPAQN